MRAVVIGCGIGGATAAFALAEIGVSVKVTKPRHGPPQLDHPCPDELSLQAQQLL